MMDSNLRGQSSAEQQVIACEKQFEQAIRSRNVQQAAAFQTDSYRLLVRFEGAPLAELPRQEWLALLPKYIVESSSIDDIKVRVIGEVAVVAMAFSQHGYIDGSPRDISGEFMITDIWLKQDGAWKICERHSSRSEKDTRAASTGIG